MKTYTNLVSSFFEEDEGAALTEYLILLGLLVGGVVAAVGVFGTNLNTAWTAWSTYFTGANSLSP